jgi:hypothetical protein
MAAIDPYSDAPSRLDQGGPGRTDQRPPGLDLNSLQEVFAGNHEQKEAHGN